MFPAKTKRLGIADDKRRYDFPLNKDKGLDFLTFLIALMTFLAVSALAGSFALGGMAGRWSSGLENKLTIEIPAEKDGQPREDVTMKALEEKVAAILRNDPSVASFEIMKKDEIEDLVAPWLGRDALGDTVPLPGLISVDMKESSPESLRSLQRQLTGADDTINVDTHQEWLEDLLSLTHSLQFGAGIITFIIALTTVTAVVGAVRTRMAIHKTDVELLHLMGASDEYITEQFQRHTFILALQGALIGTFTCALLLLVIGLFSGGGGQIMLPDVSLDVPQVLALLAAPALACLIAGLTARFTVLHALARMP